MKILVIRFSSIGDIVLTTPVMRCLKSQLAQAEIHYATKPEFEFLVNGNPYVSKVLTLKGSLLDFVKLVRAEGYDLIIDLHNNLRTRLIKALCAVPSKSVDKLNYRKWLVIRNKDVSRLPKLHVVDRYLATVKHLGVENDGQGLDYFFSKGYEPIWGLDLPASFWVGVIGGTHFTKRMPSEKWAELIVVRNSHIVLLGGKSDEVEAKKILALLEQSGHLVSNYVGKLSFNQSAELVSKSSGVITHDTGLMHVAAAFKKRVVAVWGNTFPELGMYAYETERTDFEVKDLPCRPCSKIGFSNCPKGHFSCMNLQNVSLIAEKSKSS